VNLQVDDYSSWLLFEVKTNWTNLSTLQWGSRKTCWSSMSFMAPASTQ